MLSFALLLSSVLIMCCGAFHYSWNLPFELHFLAKKPLGSTCLCAPPHPIALEEHLNLSACTPGVLPVGQTVFPALS